jgi:pilus assembly protein Flp/PilA
MRLMKNIKDRLADERGQGFVEYSLLLILIAIVVIIILVLLGTQVRNVFSNVSAGLGS